MKAFDFFSQIYCQKFEEGAIDDKELEQHDRNRGLGIYKMISDIHDEDYTTPMASLKGYKQSPPPDRKQSEVNEVLWWVAFVISCILTVLYFIGIYFTYFDDPKDFERTFNNDKKIKSGGLSGGDIKEAKMMNKQIKDSFQAPTHNQAYKDLQAKKLKEKHID